jgi:hypothetical protein
VRFPVIAKGKPVGLICAERLHPGDIAIPEKRTFPAEVASQPGRAGDQAIRASLLKGGGKPPVRGAP